jgi:hypothetical protein
VGEWPDPSGFTLNISFTLPHSTLDSSFLGDVTIAYATANTECFNLLPLPTNIYSRHASFLSSHPRKMLSTFCVKISTMLIFKKYEHRFEI